MTNYFVQVIHVIVHPKTNGDMDQTKVLLRPPVKKIFRGGAWASAQYTLNPELPYVHLLCVCYMKLQLATSLIYTSKGIMNVCRLYAKQPGLIYIESSKKVDFVGVP